MAKALPCTVIIPAYNEEAVIARCLTRLFEAAPPDHAMEVIVAANGCRDATVDAARGAAPQAQVIDLPEGSKTGAINAANAIASHFPRIVLDADVECSYATVQALAEALLEPGSMTAAPAISLDLDSADWMIRAYFRVWLKQPFANSGSGGAGCYAISEAALKQIGEFPDIIGDDIWIHTRFASEQKRYVMQDRDGKSVCTVVRPPRRALQQIVVEARRQVGNAEVLRLHPSPHNVQRGGQGSVRIALGNGAGWMDVLIHFGMEICARILARWMSWRRKRTKWTRDLTSRRVLP